MNEEENRKHHRCIDVIQNCNGKCLSSKRNCSFFCWNQPFRHHLFLSFVNDWLILARRSTLKLKSLIIKWGIVLLSPFSIQRLTHRNEWKNSELVLRLNGVFANNPTKLMSIGAYASCGCVLCNNNKVSIPNWFMLLCLSDWVCWLMIWVSGMKCTDLWCRHRTPVPAYNSQHTTEIYIKVSCC